MDVDRHEVFLASGDVDDGLYKSVSAGEDVWGWHDEETARRTHGPAILDHVNRKGR
jgi:hypothetical protein